jgi:hypothetical protein
VQIRSKAGLELVEPCRSTARMRGSQPTCQLPLVISNVSYGGAAVVAPSVSTQYLTNHLPQFFFR